LVEHAQSGRSIEENARHAGHIATAELLSRVV
jgi:hypothetical protein